ncbi:hypothetical protein Plhal304r1_c022g0077561 [Plasmopara halstedii]
MSVPAISFILQLLVAMILHVDVLVALSTTTQTLQNNQRNATDRQLRAQDSRAERKVVGDEERGQKLPFDFDLNWPPPTSASEAFDFLVHPGVHVQQGTSTSAGPSQLSKNDDAHMNYMTQYLTSLSKTNKHTVDELIDDFKAARISMGGTVPINMVSSLDISMLEPYDRLIIYCAVELRSQPEGRVIYDTNWVTMLHYLIRCGFDRNGVELILRTAKYEDVKHFIDLYDKTLCAMTTNDILRMKPIDSTSDVLSRNASLFATRARVSLDFKASDWDKFLPVWIGSNKGWSDLSTILRMHSVNSKRETAIYKRFKTKELSQLRGQSSSHKK